MKPSGGVRVGGEAAALEASGTELQTAPTGALLLRAQVRPGMNACSGFPSLHCRHGSIE